MKQYRNLIFDVGDVLLDYRWREMLCDFGLSPEEAERVGMELFEEPDHLWNRFDYGIESQQEIIELYCKKYPADAETIRFFIGHGEFMHVPRPAIWKLVRQLKEAGYHIFLLSNYPEELFVKHTAYADFMEDAEGMVVSYMIKEVKPHPVIYETLCNRYGLKPEESLFFDDRQANVDGARACGIDAIRVLSKEGLAEDLQQLLAAKLASGEGNC